MKAMKVKLVAEREAEYGNETSRTTRIQIWNV